MQTKPILAWHFCRADRRTRFSNEPIVNGETLSVTGTLCLCSKGLHASIDVFDALHYAPGPVLCRVKLSGGILRETDKLCAHHRKVLWSKNVSRLLHEFACLCAEHALRKVGVRDERPWKAIKMKRAWLKGEVTDEAFREARFAGLTGAFADDNAYAAAMAAYAATRSEAVEAANAAINAASSLTDFLARTKEIAWQRRTFTNLIKQLTKD